MSDQAKSRAGGAAGTSDPFTLPGISLPTGGGAIRGVDEKTSVALATGSASLSVRIATSAARSGFGPPSELVYDSGAGASPYGLGWHLGVATITRKTSRGLPRYTDDDVFMLAEAEDLVPVPGQPGDDPTGTFTVARYRPRVEGAFTRIERWRDKETGTTHWRTRSADNVTRFYGTDDSCRIRDPVDPARVFSWLLALAHDDRGNAVAYAYKPEDRANVPDVCYEAGRVVTANRYLKHVRYGNTMPVAGGVVPAGNRWRFEVVLDYGEHSVTTAEDTTWAYRPDAFSTFRPGFEVRTQRLCRRFLMFHHFPEKLGIDDLLVQSTDLTYSTDAPGDPTRPAVSLLTAVTHTGYLRDPATGSYATKQLPPLDLTYTPVAVHDTVVEAGADALANLPAGAAGRWHFADLDGEGTGGILVEDEHGWYYRRNVSAYAPDGGGPALRLEPLSAVATKPTDLRPGAVPQLVDVLGDGHLAVVDFGPPVAGYHARDGRGRWRPFAPFPATAAVDWTSPNLRAIDLDGDGLADVLLTDDDAYTWFPWRADDDRPPADRVAAGFGPPQRVTTGRDEQTGPVLVLAEADGAIYLADMNGDGLTDLVRVRNGEVCYWPNLGYARFGARVTMGGSPWLDAPDLFRPHRVHLADLDGSGTADLVYVSGAGARIWFNQSGNSYTAPTSLAAFPETVDADTLTVTDLLGTGTQCLVWSRELPATTGRQLRYVDLMGSVKPHLLAKVVNNVGAETTLTYATSTAYYQRDRAAGRPWVTRLAFPVHVVAAETVVDRITGTKVTSTYDYHHGYFDPVEREFRGFAMVEQSDTDSLPSPSGTGRFTEPPAAEFDLPPVRTRSWFHTGAYVDGSDVAAVLAAEFYAGDPAAVPLAGTDFVGCATAEEMREACRALRGHPLRTEVYADDGTARAPVPYAVTDHRFRVELLQAPTGTCYGVLHPIELESREFHYERDAADPRVTQAYTLATDGYGAVTRSAVVAYRRRIGGAVPEQRVTSVQYVEHDLTNLDASPDYYRLGVAVETRTYELTGLGSPDDTTPFDAATLLARAQAAVTIPYEATAAATADNKRLLGRSRTMHLSDDLTTVLPVGGVGPLALVDRVYQLALTPGQVAAVYGPLTPDAATIATTEGGYVDLDGDGSWWAPSSRVFYSSMPSAPDAAYARAHFFLPQGHIDPYGGPTTVTWADDLFVVSTTDAVHNTTSAEINYRLLRPWLVADANGNRTGARYDALGMVTASAVMGKAGDLADRLDTTTPEAAAGDDPTITYDYDLDRYRVWAADPNADPARPVPVRAHARHRVRHADPATPWLEDYTYSDGFGRIALAKAQAEPGDAPVPAADGTVRWVHSDTRWIGTGRVVFDNKGNPVKAYEPFFDTTPDYDTEAALKQWGVTAVTRYDPLSRPVRVDNPDGTCTSTTFTAWQQQHFDANDNVLTSDWYAARAAGGLGPDAQDAATKAAAQANTPLVSDIDPQGHIVHAVGDGPAGVFTSRMVIDVQGRLQATVDALGRTVLTTDFAVGGATLHTSGIDGGDRWTLPDVDGRALRNWDGQGHATRHTYDALRRPLALFVSTGGAPEIQAESMTYGEGRPNDTADNLRGSIYAQRDGVGIALTVRRDFRGNTVETSRQVLAHPEVEADWSASPAPAPDVFTTTAEFDALNRVVRNVTPDGTTTAPTWNERSLLAAMTVGGTPYVTGADHDAKGLRLRIALGNGAVTSYTYDAENFRLVRLVTTRAAGGGPVQDLTYTYDPVGNITRIVDAAQSTIFFDNALVAPVADYTYDAIYRLVTASGREHVGLTTDAPVTWDDSSRRTIPLPSDTAAMRNYTESFDYDLVGNLSTVTHVANGGNWTRTYDYGAGTSNRLASTTIGTTTDHYGYDANGNMTAMPQLTAVGWDFQNRLRSSARQAVTAGPAPTTWYAYDVAGTRLRKTTVHADGSLRSDRIYLGDFELYREFGSTGAVTLARTTLVVGDGGRAVARIETTTVDTSGPLPAPAIRYQFGNHLDSVCVELDETGAVLTYEEYYPFGATSFQAGRSAAEVSLKRYRFCGKELDTENAMNYHGARYYLPWLGRWSSADPVGIKDGPNGYAYVGDNPVRLVDPTGTDKTFLPVPGLMGDDAKLARLWEQAVQNTAGPVRGATAKETMELFKKEVERRIKTVGMGSNRKAGTAINYARRRFGAVRSELTKLLKAEGLHLPANTQVHHALNTLAKDPTKALDTNNLTAVTGNAKTAGSQHNRAHESLDKNAERMEQWEKEAKANKAAKEGTKVAETETKVAATEAVKEGSKEGLKEGTKVVAKEGAKEFAGAGTKAALKEGAKFVVEKGAKLVPFVGIAVGVALVKHDLAVGDTTAAAWDAAEAIPVVGDVVAAGHVGIITGEALNTGLGIDKVAAEDGDRAEKAASALGLGPDGARLVGATAAAISSITIAPQVALERKIMSWL